MDRSGLVSPLVIEEALAFEVVHSLAGRVRVVFPTADREPALSLAGRLGAHPAVSKLRWCPAARSLTIRFDPAIPFAELMATLPARGLPGQKLDVKTYEWLGPRSLTLLSLVAGLSGGPGLGLLLAFLCAIPKFHEAMEAERTSIALPDIFSIAVAAAELAA